LNQPSVTLLSSGGRAASGPLDLLVGGRDAEEVTVVRAADLSAAEDEVALGEQVGEDEDGVGERSREIL